MKIKFTDVRSRMSEAGCQKPDARNSGFHAPSSERGIALVITLILLSVTLVMAVAFLAISRRERGSVTTETDTTTAKLAADSALAAAEAQIIVNAFTNPYNYGLLVSTNYINSSGFQTAPVSSYTSYTNVSYNYFSGAPLSAADNVQNIANLFYLARAPVFVVTNSQTGQTDFRFYLDLNRNGMFDDTSTNVPDVNNFGTTNLDSGGNPITVNEVGDPQWIGILERPDAPHGPNNYFVARYAFIAVPIGNALDLNYIHNQVFNNNNPLSVNDGFFRNQGIGSWEINLAAFLADLNTNEWGQTIGAPSLFYQYNWPTFNSANSGDAFDDARALLAYRYNDNYNTLNTVRNLFGANGASAFQSDGIDGYSDGPLQTTFDTNADFFLGNDDPTKFWAGADNTNHYFDLMSDLFDPTKTEMNVTPPGFIERLQNAGTNVSTYNRYTFYKLLAQLGTDSSPEQGKMNLNYDNLDASGNVIPNGQTNFIAWTPIRFFTNAADRMLRLYTTNWFRENPSNYLATYYGIPNYNYYYVNPDGSILTNDPTGLGLTNIVFGWTNTIPAFGITNIPVYVNGRFVYSSAIQRVLQLAANIYDAMTNRYYDPSGFPLPTVFRPIFNVITVSGINTVYVYGFSEVTSAFELPDQPLSEPYNLANPTVLASLAPGIHSGFSAINVFGVPMIIGAKKGLPNFNQFAMENIFQITRRLELSRSSTNYSIAPPSSYKVYEQYSFGSATNSGVANQLEVEFWNSYYSNYTRPTDIYVTNWLTLTLTNDENFSTNSTFILSGYTNFNEASPGNSLSWPGYSSTAPAPSFIIPLNVNAALVLSNSVYRFNSGFPYLTTDPSELGLFETNLTGYPQPHWGLIVTNNIQAAIVDHNTGRIIDYVQLSGPNSTRDVSDEILNLTNVSSLWQTNYVQSKVLPQVSLPLGIEAQLIDSESSQIWNPSSAAGFNNFVYNGPNNGKPYGSTNLTIQSYSPATTLYQTISWQANDPLVHYMAADLFDSGNNTTAQVSPVNSLIAPGSERVFPNERYQPWGSSSQMANRISPDTSPFNFALKDPLIWSSGNWDFPTNKFPTVGWLGRVHRGTPWQTVYLKASGMDSNSWVNWTGNLNFFDATNAMPTQDRLLFDIFSTALNDNATRGQLSVNVGAPDGPSLAAWSALFSGVVVLSNNLPDGLSLTTYHTRNSLLTVPSLTNSLINPAGVNEANSSLWQIVTNINSARETFVNLDGLTNTFEHVGDILSARLLTERSPFLNWNNTDQQQYGISDEMYEWVPQQTMSLLRASDSPRYVLYCYGQTLKPAQGSLVTSGQFFGMCTNYQITSESAVRVVLRVDDANTSHPHAVIESYNVLPPD